MQTLAVLVLGFTLGPRLGAAAVALYLAQGAAGLPVFTGTPEKGIGLAYLAGPTGGFLMGFVASAWLAGWFAMKGWTKSIVAAFAASVLAQAVVFVPGLIWLGFLLGSFDKALTFGLYPFVIGRAVQVRARGSHRPRHVARARLTTDGTRRRRPVGLGVACDLK